MGHGVDDTVRERQTDTDRENSGGGQSLFPMRGLGRWVVCAAVPCLVGVSAKYAAVIAASC